MARTVNFRIKIEGSWNALAIKKCNGVGPRCLHDTTNKDSNCWQNPFSGNFLVLVKCHMDCM